MTITGTLAITGTITLTAAEKTMILVFYDFRKDNLICNNFNNDIRNQRLKLRKYRYYQNNLNWKVFGILSSELFLDLFI